MRRLLQAALVLVGALALPLPAAAATAKPAGGTLHVYVTPTTSLKGRVVLTGAIGDYGGYVTVTKAGVPNENGHFVKINLRQGGFRVNSTTLDARASQVQPTLNQATCSGQLVATGPITLFGGTGRYAGISGRLTMTETFALVLPRLTSGPHKGQCGGENVQPLSTWGAITGTGRVTFG